MAFNPRNIPWLTLIGVAGLAVGYGVGLLLRIEPMVPAFWGLCAGMVLGMVLRLVLTARWRRRLEHPQPQEDHPQGPKDDTAS